MSQELHVDEIKLKENKMVSLEISVISLFYPYILMTFHFKSLTNQCFIKIKQFYIFRLVSIPFYHVWINFENIPFYLCNFRKYFKYIIIKFEVICKMLKYRISYIYKQNSEYKFKYIYEYFNLQEGE